MEWSGAIGSEISSNLVVSSSILTCFTKKNGQEKYFENFASKSKNSYFAIDFETFVIVFKFDMCNNLSFLITHNLVSFSPSSWRTFL
jgi:hypothetical protein